MDSQRKLKTDKMSIWGHKVEQNQLELRQIVFFFFLVIFIMHQLATHTLYPNHHLRGL